MPRGIGYSSALLIGGFACTFGLFAGQWVLAAVALGVALALALGVFIESGPGSAKEVALIATLTGIAVAGRLLDWLGTSREKGTAFAPRSLGEEEMMY